MVNFRLLAAILCCVLIHVESAPPNPRRRLPAKSKAAETCIDMTRTLQPGMNHHPTLHPFHMNVTTKDIDGVKLQVEVVMTSTHMGTHMDAPRHFNGNGITVDEIPIKNFFNVPAVVVDVRNQTNANPEYQIDVKDLTAWETTHGPIPNGSLVLFRTGWGERWSDPKKFLGSDPSDPKQLKFPGLGALAASMLAQRPLVGVGTECVSIDPSVGEATAAHITILGSTYKQFILENLANLDQLPEKGARILAFPMKIGNGSGAPTRVIGCFRDESSASTSNARPPTGRSGRRKQH